MFFVLRDQVFRLDDLDAESERFTAKLNYRQAIASAW